MFALGVPISITVDDFVHMTDKQDRTVFADIGKDKSLWAPILEKAFAKMHGNFEAIVGGFSPSAIYQLTGSPFRTYTHETTSIEDLWTTMVQADAASDMITSSTFPHEQGDVINNDVGIPYSHAYTVLGVHELSNG